MFGGVRRGQQCLDHDANVHMCPSAFLAAFVGSSNLGMALGPFLSLPLAYLPPSRLAGLPLNSITAVRSVLHRTATATVWGTLSDGARGLRIHLGFIMALAWLLFAVSTLLWFPDPPPSLPIGLVSSASSASRHPLLPSEEGGEEEARPGAAGGQRSDVGRWRRGRAGWRASLPGTATCTVCLLLQVNGDKGACGGSARPIGW